MTDCECASLQNEVKMLLARARAAITPADKRYFATLAARVSDEITYIHRQKERTP